MTSAKFIEMAAGWRLRLELMTEEMHSFVDGASTSAIAGDIEHAGSIAAAAAHIVEPAIEAARSNGEFIP